jgi:ribose 5-phosphate isomerase B
VGTRKLITEEDVKKIEKQGSNVITVPKDSIITPLAFDRIRTSKITILEKDLSSTNNNINELNKNSSSQRKILIGSDHTGFKLKNILIKYVTEKGYQLTDVGTFDEKSCDYPDFAKEVGRRVSLEEADFGILIDATGIPSAIAANKIPGIRAATCYDAFSAQSSRAHNNANVLVLGSKSLGEESIKSIVDVWLSAKFEGGRHQKRIDKITAIEKEN